MSFFEIESGFTSAFQAKDRKAADLAANARLRTKLMELRDYGVPVDIPVDVSEIPNDIGGVLAEATRRGRNRLT